MQVCYDPVSGAVVLKTRNPGAAPVDASVQDNAYNSGGPWSASIAPGAVWEQSWPLTQSSRWYDFTLSVSGLKTYARRYAGRVKPASPAVPIRRFGKLAHFWFIASRVVPSPRGEGDEGPGEELHVAAALL